MNLVDRAIRDIRNITLSADGPGVPLTFVAPNAVTATIKGIFTKHHLGVSPDGKPVNTKTAHISFSESLLTGIYPVRNAAGVVDLKGHLVTVIDSTGLPSTYLIRECFPDEMVGFVVCQIGDYE